MRIIEIKNQTPVLKAIIRNIASHTGPLIPNLSPKEADKSANNTVTRIESGIIQDLRIPILWRCFSKIFSSLSSVISIKSDLTFALDCFKLAYC